MGAHRAPHVGAMGGAGGGRGCVCPRAADPVRLLHLRSQTALPISCSIFGFTRTQNMRWSRLESAVPSLHMRPRESKYPKRYWRGCHASASVVATVLRRSLLDLCDHIFLAIRTHAYAKYALVSPQRRGPNAYNRTRESKYRKRYWHGRVRGRWSNLTSK